MTRKKRRVREAREMFMDDGDEDDDGPDFQPELSQKKIAREQKREISEKQKVNRDKSIHDEDVERAARKRRGRVGSDALGDSGLFAEEKIAYAPKKSKGDSEERARSAYDFRGFDPEKAGTKKPKMKAHHKFKSKSKYKRR